MPIVREQIDPEHTLPQVELSTNNVYKRTGRSMQDEDILFEGETIGFCTIATQSDYWGKLSSHFEIIDIDEDKRGRGIGLATYVLAIERAHEQGMAFETDDDRQTDRAKKIWEYLVNKGVAEVIRPFQPIPHRKNEFKGKYRASPHSK